MTTIDGTQMRDLRKLVIEEFNKPLVSLSYIAVLAITILHLSHGAWSAFTSLGMKHGETSKKVQVGAYIFAIVLMLGFISIPLYILVSGSV
jgi:succinate dehydrogenase / fumarate reductase cytochrome b subunit